MDSELNNIVVSVIIPMYNAEKTIEGALLSVINQTYKVSFEIIVINDGSQDDSKVIVENFILKYSDFNIRLINQKNAGVSVARNAGLRVAKGNFIALLDSDDVWLENKLKRQFDVLVENPTIDFLGTNRNDEFFSRIFWKKLGNVTRISPKLLLVKFLFVVPTIIFKREILDTIGFFDEQQKFAEEGNYFIRIAQKYNCCLLNESLVITGGGKAHFGESGLSSNLKEMEKGELKNLRDSLDLKIVNKAEYCGLVLFSLLKYLRRIIIVKLN